MMPGATTVGVYQSCLADRALGSSQKRYTKDNFPRRHHREQASLSWWWGGGFFRL